jgi:hypothetical protein
MRKKERTLQLESRILLETKRKEAVYWDIMARKAVAEIKAAGLKVDLSDLDMSLGPVLDGEFANALQEPYPSDRIVKIVCTIFHGYLYSRYVGTCLCPVPFAYAKNRR